MDSRIKAAIGVFAVVALTACAVQSRHHQRTAGSEQCTQSQTMTCDRFNDETYNCSCHSNDNFRDILDSY